MKTNYIDADLLKTGLIHLGEEFPILTYDTMLYLIDSLQQEKQEVNWEEAAEEYEKEHTYQRYDGGGLTPEYDATLAESFIAGAEWQKGQDDRLVDIIYQQGIEKGKDEIRKTLKRKEKK